MTKNGVLMEPCDADRSCNLDASIFKGIFVRNLRYLLDVTEDKARVKLYRRFLDTNIASLRHNASCEPQPHKNHTCHIVYLDGAPSYPATGIYYIVLGFKNHFLSNLIFCLIEFYLCLRSGI